MRQPCYFPQVHVRETGRQQDAAPGWNLTGILLADLFTSNKPEDLWGSTDAKQVLTERLLRHRRVLVQTVGGCQPDRSLALVITSRMLK